MEKKILVMTSINPPTKAVRCYARMRDWSVIMVGDKKTPPGWTCDGVTYLPPADQEKLNYATVKEIPWNRPARANIGYLVAMECGASLITQADDDNIPSEHWGVPPFDGEFETISHDGFVNIYAHFTDMFIWPRGFPLDQILKKPQVKVSQQSAKVGVWQHLADHDTDVDAIYRLTSDAHVSFRQRPPVTLAPRAASPFNCQSTSFQRETFALLFLPTRVTPRASDIVRGLVAQPILWRHGYQLGFTAPTVVQQRNAHNYLDDFKEEILIYLHSADIFEVAQSAVKDGATMLDDLAAAYRSLVREGFVPDDELRAVEAWANDVQRLGRQS
jgi:hypothetical protein